MSRLLYSLFFLGLVALSLASSCVESSKRLNPKEACAGSGIACKFGYFCDSQGYCSPYKQAKEACLTTTDCVVGHTCKGSSSKTCIPNANPGESCNSTLVSDVPSCGTGSCTFNGTCVGGNFGDKCTVDTDCNSLFNCTAGFCKGLGADQACSGSFGFFGRCDPGLYCDTTSLTCKALLTAGKCNSNAECAYGYMCIGASPADANQCVKWGTRKVGEYCSAEDRLCEGDMRCYNNYCATGSPKYCSWNSGECPANEHCTCNSNPFVYGIGRCTADPCYVLADTYNQCISAKCVGAVSWNYANSCANLNCKDQYAKFAECSPAVRVAISVLVLIASLATLFI